VEELKTPPRGASRQRLAGALRSLRNGGRSGWSGWRQRSRRTYTRLSRTVHRTILSVAAHDCLNIAQSTAYSAIVALFPTLIVVAAVAGLVPDTTPLRLQLALFFGRILPPGVGPLLDAYFQHTPSNTHSVRALVSAGFVSFLGASNVMATLMEGLRRAGNLPDNCWTFWQRRRRAFELVPLSLAPLAVASLLVVFGHTVTAWLAESTSPDVRETVYAIALLIRWGVALGASVGLIALIYHLGVPAARSRTHASAGPGGRSTASPAGRSVHLPKRLESAAVKSGKLLFEGSVLDRTGVLAPQTWVPALPGALVATAMWFLTTLGFGWYVTRFANYSEVYGSLGVGIALLFWLYIISLSVLCGAEFNAHFHTQFGSEPSEGEIPPDSPQ
jgi:membrane protein